MSSNPASRKVLATLDLLPFPAPPEAPARIPCPHCSSPLTLHQLDAESPDRLVGTCEACKHWYLVDLAPGRGAGVLVGLPGDDVVRALSHPDPADGISPMGEEPDPGPIGKPGE